MDLIEKHSAAAGEAYLSAVRLGRHDGASRLFAGRDRCRWKY
jgi:hypothetical protein